MPRILKSNGIFPKKFQQEFPENCTTGKTRPAYFSQPRSLYHFIVSSSPLSNRYSGTNPSSFRKGSTSQIQFRCFNIRYLSLLRVMPLCNNFPISSEQKQIPYIKNKGIRTCNACFFPKVWRISSTNALSVYTSPSKIKCSLLSIYSFSRARNTALAKSFT